ncbi:toprim domain-containing protein [Methanosarcina sp. UBA289]|uniref:toprim domain-containing protein n=1 Tax=Methanosarcina sp. UBA289 TaxID=1915574 RepID=UPI0025DBCB95|nr:toprim domain-containing protein [Methanosarcina sp. UBA289]
MVSGSIFDQMDIIKIIEYYGIRLTKEGNIWYGSIPPVGSTGKSLHVWSSTNTWYCNKNHVGGGILDFIQYMDKDLTKRQAFEKAAEISGIQPASLSEEQVDKLTEREDVYNTLTSAANIYHTGLNEESYDFIFHQWGITKDSANEWNLGYASTERNLKELNPANLVKTGLANPTSTGNLGGEFYRGRVIFPFTINGKVVNMAGRQTPKTPVDDHARYKYLRTKSENKNEQISEFVGGTSFFGEDKVKREKTCCLTEGLADCIVVNQFGSPCMAVGSTGVSKEKIPHLINLLQTKVQVYICFDDDENGSGQKGALAVGQLLFDAGIKVKIIDLPRGSEKKMDIAEFMKGKAAEDFEALKEKALRFIPYALGFCPKSDSKVENLETAEEFIKQRMLSISPAHREAYITDDIKRYFGFTNKETPCLIKLANSLVQESKTEKSGFEEDSSNQQEDGLESTLLDSLKSHTGKGLFACETWVNEFKYSIAKLQPEYLSKKLVDPRTKVYSHEKFMIAVKASFQLSVYETEEIYKKIRGINDTYHQEKRRLSSILIRLQNYSPYVRSKAERVLIKGNPLKFIQNTWKKSHVGDNAVGKTLPVCVASAYIIGDNAGLSLIITGPSGKGKSNAVNDFFDLLPPGIAVRSGFSDKYLYYSESILPGSISFLDDRELSPQMKEFCKNSMTNFQKPAVWGTVINGEPKELTAPERNVFIFSSVAGLNDDQMENRCLQCEIDSSAEQDADVAEQQRNREIADTSKKFKNRIEICKCIYDLLGLLTYEIKIPFAQAINWTHTHNRRNQPKFFDIIRAVCLYKINQRKCINGFYLAEPEDYKKACEIYKETAVQNNTNLTKKEQEVIDLFIKKNQESGFYDKANKMNPAKAKRLTYKEIADKVGIATGTVRNMFSNREDRGYGLEGKVMGFGSEDSKDGTRQTLIYYTGNVEFKTYETFSSLKSDEEVSAFIENAEKIFAQETSEINEIKEEAFKDLVDAMPSLPIINCHRDRFSSSSRNIITATILSSNDMITDKKGKNNINMHNNNLDDTTVTVKKENAPEPQIHTHTAFENKENFGIKNLEDNMCENSSNTLFSENHGDTSSKRPDDTEIILSSSLMTLDDSGDGSSNDAEIKMVTDRPEVSNLRYTTEKIKEYLNKECHGNPITKSLDCHITDFKKYCPEFERVDRDHLEYVFHKVLKSISSSDNSPKRGETSVLEQNQQEEKTLSKPAAEKKGIEILKKALQAEKKGAVV